MTSWIKSQKLTKKNELRVSYIYGGIRYISNDRKKNVHTSIICDVKKWNDRQNNHNWVIPLSIHAFFFFQLSVDDQHLCLICYFYERCAMYCILTAFKKFVDSWNAAAAAAGIVTFSPFASFDKFFVLNISILSLSLRLNRA